MKQIKELLLDLKQLTHKSLKPPVVSALSSVTAILVGLLAGLIIMFISNSSQAIYGFWTVLSSGFSSLREFGQVLYFATPIIMTGLSVGFAAKTGLFNIGAAGQFIVGAYAAILVGVKCSFFPGHLHWMAAILAAMLAGALWGAIPGIFKALFNVNEVIACIMTNYIGTYLVNFLVTKTVFDSMRNQSARVLETANIPKMGMHGIFQTPIMVDDEIVGYVSSSVNSGIFFAIIFAVLLYFILEKTSFGYELKACGFNREAARYAGINEKRSIILSMVIAGALAGLGGALLYLSGAGISIHVVDVLASEGFLGIPVALLGLNNPIGIIFSGLLIAYLNVGGFNMQLYNFAPQVINIIIGVIIYFSAFALLVKSFINKFRKRLGAE